MPTLWIHFSPSKIDWVIWRSYFSEKPLFSLELNKSNKVPFGQYYIKIIKTWVSTFPFFRVTSSPPKHSTRFLLFGNFVCMRRIVPSVRASSWQVAIFPLLCRRSFSMQTFVWYWRLQPAKWIRKNLMIEVWVPGSLSPLFCISEEFESSPESHQIYRWSFAARLQGTQLVLDHIFKFSKHLDFIYISNKR